jgi:poly(3-hydroxybutyrate) depolymerase
VLHHFPGLYETAVVADTFGHLREHADRHGYLLVIPEHQGPGWQGVLGGTPAPPDLDDPGFVRALVATVNERFGGDPRRTYASGMSNGGFFTSLLGCRLADVFAAFAPVTGQLNDPATCAPGRPVPVLMIHGDADPLVPYCTTVPAALFWTTNNGCRGDTLDIPLPDVDPADGTRAVVHRYRGCPARAPVVLIQVVGGGHAWFGGDPYPVEWLGRAGRDLVANDAIWSFVSRFRLPRTAG